ncbi:HD domain-containing protein [Sulfurisphaera javensis]|uniref:HD domain-containing protein n=1 Tax=Sulfurisphaera javensis TaxID=2049879 RepID=A0AAT9GV80_9CREN
MKSIRDVIHGTIQVDEKLIERECFQRLRYITQNGMAFMVYPSMRHTRFEHSLGTFHLTQKLRDKIKSDVDFNKISKLALYHDIGHLPFSHTFEYGINLLKFINSEKYKEFFDKLSKNFEGKPQLKFHEMVGVYVLQNFMGENDLAQLMINVYTGRIVTDEDKIAKLLINSKTIDTDRLDYLQRDSYYSGAKFGIINVDRLIEVMELDVQKPAYVFPKKAVDDIEHFILGRFHMYSSVYNHCVVEIYNQIMGYAIAKLIDIGEITVDHITEHEKFIEFTDDFVLNKIKELKYRDDIGMRRIYEAIIKRKKYLKAQLFDQDALMFNSIIEDYGNEIYSKVGEYKGKFVFGANKIETSLDDIYIKENDRVSVSANENLYIVKAQAPRYKVCIGVADKDTANDISKYFQEKFNIQLTFRV